MSLSDKREDMNDWTCTIPPERGYLYDEKDVKEFIKELKKLALKENPYYDWTELYTEFEENKMKEIDKLAGDKLI